MKKHYLCLGLIFLFLGEQILSQPFFQKPYFPAGVEVAGPNKFKAASQLETVVILMDFPDNQADTLRHCPANYDSMLYSVGVYTGQPYRQGSLKDFFLENSYGDFHVMGGVAGNKWFRSTYNYSRYYDGNYMLSTGDNLASENVAQVDQTVDFSQFDLNGDKHIDALFMVHAGADGSDDGNVNHCWSHAISYFNYATNDGITIDGVTNVPEFAMVTAARETTMCCIAVMCHELGHLAGLPDLYDYSRWTWGVGYWGVMGYGAWGSGGNTPWSPAHMDAWSKVEAGFVTPVVITKDTVGLRILDAETNPVAYKIWRNGVDRDTCFYLENRQQKGFDANLPNAGLLIWHIDPGKFDYDDVVDLEEDSTFHLDNGTGIRPDPHLYHPELGAASDVLPGTWNRSLFNNTTVPNSRATNGAVTDITVSNIHLSGDTVICNIYLSGTGVENVAEKTEPLTPRLSISPNPFRDRVNIKFNNNQGSTERVEIAIYSCTGELVYKIKNPAGKGFIWTGVNMSGQPVTSGIYLVRILAGKDVFTDRLTKIR